MAQLEDRLEELEPLPERLRASQRQAEQLEERLAQAEANAAATALLELPASPEEP